MAEIANDVVLGARDEPIIILTLTDIDDRESVTIGEGAGHKVRETVSAVLHSRREGCARDGQIRTSVSMRAHRKVRLGCTHLESSFFQDFLFFPHASICLCRNRRSVSKGKVASVQSV